MTDIGTQQQKSVKIKRKIFLCTAADQKENEKLFI